MVDRITILEPHFDGAQFGPRSIGNGTAESSERNAGSRGRMIIGIVLLLLVIAVLAARRFASLE